MTTNVYHDLDMKAKTLLNLGTPYGVISPISGPASSTNKQAMVNYFGEMGLFSSSSFDVVSYEHAAPDVVNNAFIGGSYSPTQDRIYMSPSSQGTTSTWHYIDCDTGAIVAYAHGSTASRSGITYNGAVYSPNENKIYFVPRGQSAQPTWHYVNCDDGTIVDYDRNSSALQADGYFGGSYSPTQNRIYFCPLGQADDPTWHYIDCDTGTVVEYECGVSIVNFAYAISQYSPNQNRIYLTPFSNSGSSTWHYIDCDTGNVVGYEQPTSSPSGAYWGCGFLPTLNRIYFSPNGAASGSTWHYIDCDTGNVVGYRHLVSTAAYSDMVYHPILKKMFLIPYNQANAVGKNWHYIDGNTGEVVEYVHTTDVIPSGTYVGGVYAPRKNRLYLIPWGNSDEATWHYIEDKTGFPLKPNVELMSSSSFNNY
jgi:hypothetical protein